MKKNVVMVALILLINTVLAQVPTNVLQKLNIVYTIKNGWEGKLDFYQQNINKKAALVVYIHGGGWVHGNKEAEYEKIKVFIQHGYSVANIEYRLAKQDPAPAAIEDVNEAINYLIKNTTVLNYDVNKMVLMGGSAGAHLALLAGLQSQRKVYNKRKFKVAAIISKYGPTDLLTWKPATDARSASSAWLADKKNDTTFIKSLSPVNYVAKNKIPTLFIHGDQDQTVPIQQSETLYQMLKSQRSPTQLYIVKGGKHGNFGEMETAKMDSVMIGFLSKYLSKK
ncbi:alpha/beta hydrolase [Pedobacter sp. Leaf250]|uniref:alpha/beta hydrolase n=1 Tax=Pedobacter sp. Leaf250 TaxID=2876559 RepID=UPI001E3571E0|nr:alpha/beta hydrolase [Pedobacter sp. Leaf250]